MCNRIGSEIKFSMTRNEITVLRGPQRILMGLGGLGGWVWLEAAPSINLASGVSEGLGSTLDIFSWGILCMFLIGW